jgi:subtilase family serine protease
MECRVCKRTYVAIISVMALLAVLGSSAYAQLVKNNVPAAIRFSKDLGRSDLSKEINITVHLELSDRAAFDKAVAALYDPASPTYHHWMTNTDLAKYAPTEAQREMVREELRGHSLTILSTDAIGFSVRARGTIGNIESAFNTELHEFEYNGRSFRANVRNARLTGEAGNHVSTVAGLEGHQVRPLAVRAVDPKTKEAFPSVPLGKMAKGNTFPPLSTTSCLSAPATYDLVGATSLPVGVYTGTVYSVDSKLICDYLPNQLQTALGLDQVYAAGYDGTGETIVLVEAYGYPTLEKDANAFFALAGLPKLTSSNFRIVYPQGKPNPTLGIIEGWNIEMALDLDWAHSIAPGAKIVDVITVGQDNEDFQNSISYVAENNLGNQISNSYEEDLDLLSGPSEQTSWDEVLQVATAKGITVNFSSGDSGDNGVGKPLGAPLIPSIAPHATAVGGTSILNDVSHPGSTITTAWGDTWVFLQSGEVFDPPLGIGLIGGGGGGESTFWPKPSWQSALPGTRRVSPDISALSDPFTGVPIVISQGSTQFIQYGWGGTSLGCPIFTAFWALANQKAGHALGQAAPLIAALPYGGVQDILPITDSTAHNVTGVIVDQNGATTYSASEIFVGLLEGNKSFTSAIWPEDSEDVLDFGFGLDSSLTVRHGWDNATGFGTPYGLAFINAVTAGN